jgi:hypothetical protein
MEDFQMEDFQKEVDQWPLETICIERIQRPTFFRDFKVADVLDFKQLVDDFEDAKSGEQPEDIYRVLYCLQREQKAIDRLNWEYVQKTGQILEEALQDHFEDKSVSDGDLKKTKARLEYALQLINKGQRGTEQVVESRPPRKQEFSFVARRIHQALHPSDNKPKPENVYAALTPLERNTECLCKLDAWYNQNFQTNLKSDIENNLEGKSKVYALYLIGDQTMEKKEISEYEVMRLTKALFPQEKTGRGGHTFDRGDGLRVPVPYDYPREWCKYRAHIVCELLKEMGYTSEKVFASSYCLNEHDQKMPNLRFRTDLAPDMPGDKDPTIPWGYHIASCIQVKTASGVKKRLVLDPGLHHRPLTVEKWMKDKLGQDSYEPIELNVYQTKVTEEYQKNPKFARPTGTYMLIASRKFFGEPIEPKGIEMWLKDTDIPDQFVFEAFKDEGRPVMIDGAKQVPYHRMARSIREELREHTIKNAKDVDAFFNTIATNFLADVSQFRSSVDSDFRSVFPNLYKDLIEYVKTCISHSSSELFREHVSGEAESDQKGNDGKYSHKVYIPLRMAQ